MSEYTTVYLRNKNTPLLEYREYPASSGREHLSNEKVKVIDNKSRTKLRLK